MLNSKVNWAGLDCEIIDVTNSSTTLRVLKTGDEVTVGKGANLHYSEKQSAFPISMGAINTEARRSEAEKARLEQAHRGLGRFVLIVGAMPEEIERQDGKAARAKLDTAMDETLADAIIWDRQQRQSVITVHGGWGNLICLEQTDSDTGAPFTNLETWLNSLSSDTLASEGLPVPKGSGNLEELIEGAVVHLRRWGFNCHFDDDETSSKLVINASNQTTWVWGEEKEGRWVGKLHSDSQTVVKSIDIGSQSETDEGLSLAHNIAMGIIGDTMCEQNAKDNEA